MNKKYAFVDEFGAYGYDFENPGCSTHFIITAIVVDENDLSTVSNGVEVVRRRYFQKERLNQVKLRAIIDVGK